MAVTVDATIAIARAQEQLRQERETFDQKKRQDARWFVLRLVTGWIAVALLPALGGVSAWVIANNVDFSTGTVTLAAAALFVDSLGLVLSVWRIVLGTGPERLGSVTQREFTQEASWRLASEDE